ncbi:hypothetical protein psyc5s11_33780 [Clostridium gelidum]|uniref:Uncharacterized protein n=1 Tax=Clostridium gelidum TaxID=704125 RepID=A0ABM7T7P6_9CLOT|nr:hypothetical protein [Clostridium gelidum]BCZ47311.1 hypothetical protein psyc5s11_33780 [Clostridium gelidum]
MKKTKLTALALTALIAFGGIANSAFAATATADTTIATSTHEEGILISNEDLIKDAKGITKEEKTLLLDNYNARDKLSDQIYAIRKGKSQLNDSEQKKSDSLTKELYELCKKVSDIEIKAFGSTNNYVLYDVPSTDVSIVDSINNGDFIKDPKAITKEEKALLIENYKARYKIMVEIDNIVAEKSTLNDSEQKKVDSLTKQLDELCQKVSNIETKAKIVNSETKSIG